MIHREYNEVNSLIAIAGFLNPAFPRAAKPRPLDQLKCC